MVRPVDEDHRICAIITAIEQGVLPVFAVYSFFLSCLELKNSIVTHGDVALLLQFNGNGCGGYLSGSKGADIG